MESLSALLVLQTLGMQKWAAIAFLRPSVKSNVLFMTCLLKKQKKKGSSFCDMLVTNSSVPRMESVLEVANI
jgi:hypothetical protein